MKSSHPTRSARLRALMADHCVALPGAINALSARAIERAGFEAMYLSGAVLSNSVLGVPDVGLTTLSEAVAHARRCVAVTDLPTIMDADTGFGEGEDNVARTVQEFEHAGLSGLHLEDQEFPKRCGHLTGKSLVPCEEFCAKLAAAVAARRDPDFLIVARTDARGVTSYDDAVARAHAYLKAGADAIFPEALTTRDELARFARDVSAPLLANMTEFGKTPTLSVSEFAALGFRLVIFPVTLQRVAMRAMESALAELRARGTQAGFIERMQTRQELYDLLYYDPGRPGGWMGGGNHGRDR
ncbi:MAG: methylisocitrate lyase [Phycisphaerae bacterium]